MKFCHFTLLLTALTFTGTAFAEEKKSASESKVYGDVEHDETLQKMLDIPEVAAIYKDCDKRHTVKSEIPNCMWKDVKDNANLKKQVQDIYAQGAKKEEKGRAPASDKESKKDSLINRRKNVGIDYNSDPTVKALSEFFGSKLAEVFQTSDEDLKKNKLVSVDHEDYIKLYKSELGKTIVNAMTSYCLGTKDSTECRNDGICEYSEGNKEDNIKALQTMDLGSPTDQKRWKSCIGGIPKICYEPNAAPNDESKTQACLVMDFVKTARKNIILANEQEKFYENLRKDNADGHTMAVANMEAPDAKKKTADNLTQITAADISKGKIAEANDALKKEAADCLNDAGQIKNAETCKKFLSEKKEENEKAIAEFGLGQEIQKDLLEEKLKDDKNVAAYLKEEGYDEAQIAEMTKKDKIEDVKKEIKDRFDAEKAAIIASMSKKIEDKTAADPKDQSKNIGKLGTIKKQLESRTKDLSQLVQFTNIVSGYLDVTDEGSGKTSRNTASVYAELDSMDEKDSRFLKENMKKADLERNSNSTEFKVKDINEILKYKAQPKPKN